MNIEKLERGSEWILRIWEKNPDMIEKYCETDQDLNYNEIRQKPKKKQDQNKINYHH